MSQMATTPVFACRICGAPVYVTQLRTTEEDPNNSKLIELMRNLHKIALCDEHLKQYNWFASQNRADEFLLNPHGVLYNVIDDSGVDYYGRES